MTNTKTILVSKVWCPTQTKIHHIKHIVVNTNPVNSYLMYYGSYFPHVQKFVHGLWGSCSLSIFGFSFCQVDEFVPKYLTPKTKTFILLSQLWMIIWLAALYYLSTTLIRTHLRPNSWETLFYAMPNLQHNIMMALRKNVQRVDQMSSDTKASRSKCFKNMKLISLWFITFGWYVAHTKIVS